MCNCDTGFSTFVITFISVILAAPIGAFLGVKIVDWIDRE